ncbi:MAG TPA: kinase, partial [Bacteroidetes bacterium]|nr:kinase [Bacteroidota bacterium]
MADIIKLNATDGTPLEFVDKIIGQGGMKDVFFSPDKSYVIGFFRNPQDAQSRDRVETIVGAYRKKIFEQ